MIPFKNLNKRYIKVKKIELFNIPSPFRSASLNISLTSSSVNLSPNEVKAFLSSVAFIQPSRSLSNTFNQMNNNNNYIKLILFKIF
jgi:hypothetical protein